MPMINSGTYEFKSLNNLLDFVKPLVVEGYSVAINTIPGTFPHEYTIEKFIVYVGEKGVKFYCDEETKGIDDE